MRGRENDHNLLAKQRHVVQAEIGRSVATAVDRNLGIRGDELFFHQLDQLQLDVGAGAAKTGEQLDQQERRNRAHDRKLQLRRRLGHVVWASCFAPCVCSQASCK